MIEKHLYTSEEKLKWWGYGEWVEEPDQVDFQYNGIDCRIWRICCKDGPSKDHRYGGFLCGYVKVPIDHPYYGKGYDDIPIDAHGDLTYSEIDEENHGHLPKSGHWIGFDCTHSMDYSPSGEYLKKTIPALIEIEREHQELIAKFNLQNNPINRKSYKNIDFCVKECQSIVNQLLETQPEIKHDMHL